MHRLGRLGRLGRHVGHRVREVLLQGSAVSCPCCGRSWRRFRPYRDRPGVRCPGCGSLPRHRATRVLLDRMAVTGRALHVAPDTILRGHLGGRATTLNIVGSPDVRGDLTRLPFPAGTFELIVCSHVLEHIPDDAAALAEMRRALAPGGVLLLIVPGDFDTDATYEDWSIVSPEGRHDAFGQWDHVRVYGRDARARVERQPWSVDEIGDGLEPTERLYICRA